MRFVLSLSFVLCAVLQGLGNEPPELEVIPEMTAHEGERLPALEIRDIASDPDHALDQLVWSCSEGSHVDMRIVRGRIYFSLRDAEWWGETFVTLVVCDPAGACASQDIHISVSPVNDPPVLSIRDQFARTDEGFQTIRLADVVTDVDDDIGSMTWTASSRGGFIVRFGEGEVEIVPPSPEWTGLETIEFSVCDASGATARQTVSFGRAGEAVAVTLVGNAGFILQWGEKKVAVDALHYFQLGPGVGDRMTRCEPPFDNIDLILVTHSHDDHFAAAPIVAQLVAVPSSLLVAPADVIAQVRPAAVGVSEERLVSIDLGAWETRSLTVAGIDLDVIDYPHSSTRALRNVGFRVHLGGAILLHTGDIHLIDLGPLAISHAFAGLPVDIAFVPEYWMTDPAYGAFIRTLPAKVFVPMHADARDLPFVCAAARALYSNVFCFAVPLQALFVPILH
ncbi:MAG: MBL fold metallo-hydrolase [Candidatus Bipolaricaulis sp.]|nr:MBL fold metallo-hydrolase [Candidatus Bipolaricaulis sp.]